VLLAPGNRTDVLVRPTRNGRYALVAEPYDRGTAMMMGGGAAPVRRAVIIATLAVSGTTATAPPTPLTLPAPPVPSGPSAARRRITFAMGMGGAMGMGAMGFTIDGRSFDPNRDDQDVTLGTTQEWTVVNTSPMDHPFHLHAWPFHVLDASPGTPPTGVLQDVVLVPAHGQVRLRVPSTDYPGRSVYNCHILDHEDLGMMGVVNVRGR
jgi:FtsP/CotA-like multicopper oxidase with cupredoxin domain